MGWHHSYARPTITLSSRTVRPSHGSWFSSSRGVVSSIGNSRDCSALSSCCCAHWVGDPLNESPVSTTVSSTFVMADRHAATTVASVGASTGKEAPGGHGSHFPNFVVAGHVAVVALRLE